MTLKFNGVRVRAVVKVQNFIKLSAAVRELSWAQRKNSVESNTVRRYRADSRKVYRKTDTVAAGLPWGWHSYTICLGRAECRRSGQLRRWRVLLPRQIQTPSIQKSPQITHRTHGDSSQFPYPYHTHTHGNPHGNPHTHGSPVQLQTLARVANGSIQPCRYFYTLRHCV